MTADEIADAQTKEELLKRMRSYVESEARRKRVPEWSIVGHIFGNGSGVSYSLWYNYIKKKDAPRT